VLPWLEPFGLLLVYMTTPAAASGCSSSALVAGYGSPGAGSGAPEVAAVCVAGIRTVTDVGFGGHVAFGDGNWHQ
jgi:hypothetical protein